MATTSPWQLFLKTTTATFQQLRPLPSSISQWARRCVHGLLGGLFLLPCHPVSATDVPPDTEVFPDSPFRFKEASQQQVSIAYKSQSNLLVIPAYLNGRGPFDFLLDTGIATPIITNPKPGKQVGMQAAKPCGLFGVGRKAPVLAYRTNPVRVEFAGIEAPVISFMLVTKQTLAFEALTGIIRACPCPRIGCVRTWDMALAA